jgi:hypothetical protein
LDLGVEDNGVGGGPALTQGSRFNSHHPATSLHSPSFGKIMSLRKGCGKVSEGMSAFRRVEGALAGPAALGILVPPGRRTVLILRPRALAWDLLLVRAGEGSAFREMGLDEAHAAAQGLHRALEAWAAGGPGRVEPVALPEDQGFWVRAGVGRFTLLACPRLPGQPYRPLVLADAVSAQAAAGDLAAVLCPPAGADQELYFNARHFSR